MLAGAPPASARAHVLGVGREDLVRRATRASAIASSAASFSARVASASPWLASRARSAVALTSCSMLTGQRSRPREQPGASARKSRVRASATNTCAAVASQGQGNLALTPSEGPPCRRTRLSVGVGHGRPRPARPRRGHRRRQRRSGPGRRRRRPALELLTARSSTATATAAASTTDLGARGGRRPTRPVELWSHPRRRTTSRSSTEWRSERRHRRCCRRAPMKRLVTGLQRLLLGSTREDRTATRRLRQDPRHVCLNGDSERIRPDAPARSPYPWGCPYNPFTRAPCRASRQGWSIPLLASTGRRCRLRARPLPRSTAAIAPRVRRRCSGSPPRRPPRRTRCVVRKGSGEGSAASRRTAGHRVRPARPRTRADRPGGRTDGRRRRPTCGRCRRSTFDRRRDGHHLRFSATVWNAGNGPLVVDGFRRRTRTIMDAYQYFFDDDGNQTGYSRSARWTGTQANHQHWHFQDFARYRLLNADQTEACARSKESFCLANTDAVDYTVPAPTGSRRTPTCTAPAAAATPCRSARCSSRLGRHLRAVPRRPVVRPRGPAERPLLHRGRGQPGRPPGRVDHRQQRGAAQGPHRRHARRTAPSDGPGRV